MPAARSRCAQMNRGQDNGARVRMARAQIVEKFLPKIVGRIDIEDEEAWPLVHDQLLRFLQTMRDIDMRLRRRFAQSGQHRTGQVFVRRENKDQAGLRCGRFVQSSKYATKNLASRMRPSHLVRECPLLGKWKVFSRWRSDAASPAAFKLNTRSAARPNERERPL